MFGFLDDMADHCHYINRSMVPDGRGGSEETWTLGGPFSVIIHLSNSMEQEVAQSQGVKGIYDLTTGIDTRLPYHQVFRRDRDGKIFRVTSMDENTSPDFSGLDIRKVRAEAWELTGPLLEE